MTIEILLVVYCCVIVLASTAGGRLPRLVRMTHLKTQLLMSFVGGLMLGIALLHLMPHAVDTLGSASKAGAAALMGVVTMFLLMRAFHPPHDHGGHDHGGDSGQRDHDHSCEEKPRRIGWVGMLFGLGLHTMIDGVALSASVVADADHGVTLGFAGIGTFLAVALHKPLDAFAITSMMKASGWSVGYQNLVNFLFSLACPLGALLFYFGFTQFSDSAWWLGCGLALSAGFFVCISLSDLLPEVAFHDHDRGKLTAALFLGIALAVGVENLPGHSHEHAGTHLNQASGKSSDGQTPQHDHSDHEHAGHDH
ncbi:MAG: ZIP family metal transporter [Rubripirellula sp.]|nr:iron permease [Rhodopirellula sp.]MCH1438414.1 ZIP family metal transporter [Rubripirellula sp.]